MNIYGIYENDVLLFKGTSKEVADKYDFTTKEVSSYANRGTRLRGQYVVKREFTTRKPKKEKKSVEYIYGLFEKSKLVDKGTPEELAKKYNTSVNQLTTYVYTGNNYLGKYLVKKIVKTDENFEEMSKRINKKKFQENLDYLMTNLKIYGNTNFNEKMDDYIPELKKRGYNVKITLRTSSNMRGRKEKWWLVELEK